MTAAIQFPSKETLISHLEKYPKINTSYIKQKNILGTIAAIFENKSFKSRIDAEMFLFQTFCDLNDRVKLPDLAFQFMYLHFCEALNGYPAGPSLDGKKIEEMKSDTSPTDKKE